MTRNRTTKNEFYEEDYKNPDFANSKAFKKDIPLDALVGKEVVGYLTNLDSFNVYKDKQMVEQIKFRDSYKAITSYLKKMVSSREYVGDSFAKDHMSAFGPVLSYLCNGKK